MSRFPLSGRALASQISRSGYAGQVEFRTCLNSRPLPHDFHPQVVVLNCAEFCPGGVPAGPSLYPFAKCIVIARAPEPGQQVRWIRAGVHGILDEAEDLSLGLLPKVIEKVMSGELWAPRKVLSECFWLGIDPNRDPLKVLTMREQQLMSLVQLGLGNDEVAGRLRLSTKTVKSYMSTVFRKLGVSNRTEATRKMRELATRDLVALQS